MALLLQQQSQPTGLLLPPLGHMLTPAMRNTVHLSISRGYIAVTRKIVVLLVMRRGQMLVSWWLEATAIWAGVNLPYTSRPRETSFSTVWWIILTIPNQTFLQPPKPDIVIGISHQILPASATSTLFILSSPFHCHCFCSHLHCCS